jgi:hypothetical protein
MDAFEFCIGIAQFFAEGDDVGEVLFISSAAHAAEHGQLAV